MPFGKVVMMVDYPAELLPVFDKSIVCEYASFTRAGEPITMPVTPYVSATGTLDISTGLTYPTKAERARRNPSVALLFSDPKGSGLTNPPVVLVQGKAAVRDQDLQANTDRYMEESYRKIPSAYKGTPKVMLRNMAYYYVRIWVEVTPARILWWPGGNTASPPQSWEAPADTKFPESDPAPQGKAPGAWKENPPEWRTGAQHAVQTLGLPVLTVAGAGGYPFLMRAKSVALNDAGFVLDMPQGMTWNASGSACLTFHYHGEVFTGQENMMFVGEAQQDGARVTFTVKRRISDWSAGRDNQMLAAWSFITAGMKLRSRVREEAARRGQPVPKINVPG
jgi:hypothetical protein